MKRSTGWLLVIALALAGIVAYGVANYVESVARLAFADEQTEIFQAMVGKAGEALAKSPPDAAAAVEYLCYAHRYYPSGTKQVTGSRLDNIVERGR